MLAPTVMVAVEVPLPVIEAGTKDTVDAAGIPVALRATVSVKPLAGVIVTV